MKKSFVIAIIFFFIISIFFLSIPKKANAIFSKVSNSPTLDVGLPQTWDSSQVYGPIAIFENNLFKMWYSGNNGSKRQIGYAYSTDAASLSKYPENPIISWDLVNTSDIGLEHPTLIKETSNNQAVYKMWLSNVGNNFQSFDIFYMSSNNGLDWNQLTSINLSPTNTQWDSQGKGAPTVVFNKTQSRYHLLYVAKGNYNNSTRWRIGYATSSDGINWTKHTDPVLQADQPWEGWDVGNPSVLYENGIYHMWYHGDGGIGYATSFDGINWTKDQNNPVLTPGPYSFDSKRVLNPFVLKKDSTYYMYYTGIGNDNKWRIGLATSDSLPPSPPTPTPTTTPTPTQTPTPTATPTPTTTPSPANTPTPTTPIFSPIIIIPGLGASWNPKDMFSCNLSSSSSWKLAPYVNIYNRLIKTLTKNAQLKFNKDVFVYTYDWRQPLDKQSKKFKNYINKILSQKPAGTKVRVIGHSLGGLIARSYITNNPLSHKVQSIITVGTPHKGTLLAYPLWEKGDVPTDDKLMKIAVNILINHCQFKLRNTFFLQKRMPSGIISKKEVVHRVAPIIKQLLPIFDYLRKNGNIKPVNSHIYQNGWLEDHTFPYNFIQNDLLTTLSGNKVPTLRYFDVKNPSRRNLANGDWVDGKPKGQKKVREGDGVVLRISSQINDADNETINGGHSEIISKKAGIKKILQFLNLGEIKPAQKMAIPEVTSTNVVTISIDKNASLRLANPLRKFSESKDNIIAIYNPTVGVYRLNIKPYETDKGYLQISYFNANGELQNISYRLNLSKNKFRKFLIIYNPTRNRKLKIIKV